MDVGPYWLIQFKAVADNSVGQVLAKPLFLKVKTKFLFTKRFNQVLQK